MTRIHDGVAYLAREMSASRDEFRRDNQPGGDMLLSGLLSRGLAQSRGDRVALSEQGRRMHAVEVGEPEC